MRDRAAIVAQIAADQHGLVTVADLRAAGVDKRCAYRWRSEGRLHRVHVGVYAVGHRAPSMLGDYAAAVLAGGTGARLSHAPCSHLLKLERGRGSPPPPEVTVPTTAHRRRPGVVIHRVREIAWQDCAAVHGIAIMSVPRTLLDLAPRLTPEQLAEACHEAWVHHRTRPHHVEACIARNPHKPAAKKLLAAMVADVTLSELERGCLKLLRAHALPLPRTNIDHAGDKVDCHWPQFGLTVELLSYRFHGSRAAFERDVARRRRSNHVAYTYGDVFERPGQTVADLRTRLR
ncbi:MAG: hypothetical protein QOJ89_1589 [bacterium]|jgi:hypothetical protein